MKTIFTVFKLLAVLGAGVCFFFNMNTEGIALLLYACIFAIEQYHGGNDEQKG